jgi:hypothetical protein
MAKHEGSRYELHRELERGLGERGAVMLMEELQAIREDVRHLSVKVDGIESKMDTMEARIEARIFRTALLVNIPSIMAAVGLAFAATRIG